MSNKTKILVRQSGSGRAGQIYHYINKLADLGVKNETQCSSHGYDMTIEEAVTKGLRPCKRCLR